jgi:hypothetical protein
VHAASCEGFAGLKARLYDLEEWELEFGSWELAVEVSQVRRRLQGAIAAAREQAQRRRVQAAEAERAYATFLQDVATPVTRQVANALKTEGHAFTVFTPGGGLRLASDRGRDDFIEFALDTDSTPAQVVARISHTRGSRTIDEEQPLKPGTPPESVTEEDVLDFLLGALTPWLER